MRLHSIRLHPFGRFADRSWDLAKSLVVIHGPNELGKTTLRQAIFHALFTPTKQTDTQLKTSVKPWLPLPAGDHAHVRARGRPLEARQALGCRPDEPAQRRYDGDRRSRRRAAAARRDARAR
jgi:recombinational DNA repair ATPase RecF